MKSMVKIPASEIDRFDNDELQTILKAKFADEIARQIRDKIHIQKFGPETTGTNDYIYESQYTFLGNDATAGIMGEIQKVKVAKEKLIAYEYKRVLKKSYERIVDLLISSF